MTASSFAIVLIVGVSALLGVLCHFFMRNFWGASILSAITASLTLQLINYLASGYLDPYILSAFLTGTIIALAISFIIGLPFWLHRRHH
jgi:hypothetical protein